MNESQRAAAERLADELQRFDGAERESLRDEAAALLRELLATPVVNQQMTTEPAEPVAWMFARRYGSGLSFVKPPPPDDDEFPPPVPLYRHPPQQRRPLTDEVVAKLINAEWATSDVPSAWNFARAVERAIGEQE